MGEAIVNGGNDETDLAVGEGSPGMGSAKSGGGVDGLSFKGPGIAGEAPKKENDALPGPTRGTMEWECDSCGKTFRREIHRGRLRTFCEECRLMKKYQKPGIITNAAMKKVELAKEEIPLIIAAMLDNPALPITAIAVETGVAAHRIRKYMATNAGLSELRRQGSMRVTNLIPKAITVMDEILDDREHSDRYKAAAKILESGQVLGPERVDVTVSPKSKTIEELRKLIQDAAKIPEPTILEAELISSDPPSDANV